MNKLKKVVKKLSWVWNDLLYKSNLKTIKTSNTDRRILVYHGVTKNAKTDINSRFISTSLFEKHLLFYKTHFHVVSLEDYLAGASQQDKLTIAITFDDGYLNNLEEVLPLLEKHAIPATFFITTIEKAGYKYLWPDLIDLYRYTGPKNATFLGMDFQKRKHEYVSTKGTLKQLLKSGKWLDKKEVCDQILADNAFINDKRMFPYFKLMNEEQIKLLSNSPYASIGSHALYHNCLTKVTLEEAQFEIKESKKHLEKLIDNPIDFFAYPDGDYNESLIEITKNSGYKHQLLLDYNDPKHPKDKRLANRFGINPYISFNNQMQCIIDGKY